MLKPIFVAAFAVALAGCGHDVVGTTPPTAEMKRECPDLPNGPKNDGDPKVRAPYEAKIRQLYGNCKDSHHGLIAWSNVVVAKP